ncbi:TIGR03032 family protein [Halioglobus maricola]|uniref:TIGR03032 family protein n=1 Tax=Halioglobus maricola TaxID=2601894 RepID=A0A5P9NFX9_9GAMM|nr:TIGR03032 family protein [Halioglobus maricola]QFU74445.1 TIGR03032 family protein [Halioglobus maricola]
MSDSPAAASGPREDYLESVHTRSFTELLAKNGISILITTYQAGKVIIAREDNGVTNTHFRAFRKPMGLAVAKNRIVLGALGQIYDLRNVPSAAPKLEPLGRHTACYVPRTSHVTGDIDIHEMALLGKDIVFVNTRFSCLCRVNQDYNFEPIWRPPFISAYDPRDRCHLNGLAVRDNQVRYVSALGTSDEPGGWRKDKTNGGVIIDIKTDGIVRDSLSMPHSPRWYAQKLWYLESGKGSVVAFDPETGEDALRVTLPGFTRGIDFFGPYAFVGISQVRETAVFSDLEITRSQPVRDSGVWVIDVRNGETVAFLKFTGGVQEIFAVNVLQESFPDIATENEKLAFSTFVIPDELVNNVAAPDPDWKSTENFFEAGNGHLNKGEVEEAIACYEQALESDANYLPARYNLGLAHFKADDKARAKAVMLDVLQREAGHAEALFTLGRLELDNGNSAAAVDYLSRSIEIQPNFEAAAKLLAEARTSAGKG